MYNQDFKMVDHTKRERRNFSAMLLKVRRAPALEGCFNQKFSLLGAEDKHNIEFGKVLQTEGIARHRP